MSKRIFNRILITGASSGIGRALAEHYLASGSHVGVCGRDRARLAEVCLVSSKASALEFDTTDRDASEQVISGYIESQDGLDLAILNAGTHEATDAARFDATTYARLMTANYIGTLYSLAPVIAAMKSAGRGTVAIVGSVAGYTGLPNAGAYCASKSALMRLTESLRVELRDYGIDVRLISPGFVKTPLTAKNDFPMPFLMDIDKAVERIVEGLVKDRFEIAFPRRLVWSLRILAALPRPVYFQLVKHMLPANRPS